MNDLPGPVQAMVRLAMTVGMESDSLHAPFDRWWCITDETFLGGNPFGLGDADDPSAVSLMLQENVPDNADIVGIMHLARGLEVDNSDDAKDEMEAALRSGADPESVMDLYDFDMGFVVVCWDRADQRKHQFFVHSKGFVDMGNRVGQELYGGVHPFPARHQA